MNDGGIEVRDLRQQDWIWTSKGLLFHKAIDGNTFKIYCGLASYANNYTQQAFPSIETLANKLHVGRNTVMRGLKKLEENGFIGVERTEGQHNVYILLHVEVAGAPSAEKVEMPQEGPKLPTPKERAQQFFDGIEALMRKQEVPWLQEFLRAVSEKNKIPKQQIWDEVRNFGAYWTERNGTGTRERWQLEKTFEVELRLATWFRRKGMKQFTAQGASAKGKKIVSSTTL